MCSHVLHKTKSTLHGLATFKTIWLYSWILLSRQFGFSLSRPDFTFPLDLPTYIKRKYFVQVVRRINQAFTWSCPSIQVLHFTRTTGSVFRDELLMFEYLERLVESNILKFYQNRLFQYSVWIECFDWSILLIFQYVVEWHKTA